MSSIATKRSLTYWVFLILFLLGGGPILTSDAMFSPFMHNMLDGLAALFAIIAAGFACRAYARTKATALLIVALTLAATAVLEVLHEVADAGWLSSWMASDVENFMAWSWHAGRIFLACGLLAAAVHATRENFGAVATVGRKNLPAPRLVGIVLLVTLPVTVYGLLMASLPSIYYSSLASLRMPEFVSGIVFLLALLLFVRRGNWRTDSYGHWLNIALVASVNAQFFCMAFSRQYLDTSFGAAHVLKVVSFAAIIVGFALAHRATAPAEDADAHKPKGLGLGVKVALLCGFIGFICVVPVAIKSSANLHDIAASNGMQNLSAAAASTSRELYEQRRRIDSDLDYLIGAKVIAGLNRARQNGGFDGVTGRTSEELIVNLSRMGQNLLVSDTSYLSLAYIDAATGVPVVRVEQLAGSALAARNRPALQAQEVALAQKVLNGGKTSTAIRSDIFMLTDETAEDWHVPVEGTALALYSAETDAITGILIAHSNVAKALTPMPLYNVDTALYVVNSQGQFLAHPDVEKEMSPEGYPPVDYTLADEFPNIDFTVSAEAGSVNGFIFEPPQSDEMLVGFSGETTRAASGEPLLYVYAGPRAQMEVTATLIGEDLQRIAQFNLLAAIVIGWFFARRFAKPVQQLSYAASEFARTGAVTEMATEGRDEIGMLSKSLSEMMNEVATQREKLMLLSSAVESSVDSTIITTIGGTVEYVNPHYEQYAGVTSADVLGKDILELNEFKQNRHILSQTPDKKGNEYVWSGEMRMRRADGKLHDELVTILPIRDAEGEMINTSMVIEDITERRAMERNIERKSSELQRSNRDLEQFAYVASHDLKSPLRAIEVLVSWLKDDLEEYDVGDVQENLDLLSRRTSRLSRLLDDLLAYSRAGRKIGDVKTINTKEFVEDIAVMIGPPEGFRIEVADDLPTITAYHAPLETVFRNLIGNGIKHSPVPEEGRIRIYCEDRGDLIEFAVEDNGTGIDPQYADKVFKMFQTLQARDEKEGSGMGLAIVQRIIDWQGGKIWFEEGPDAVGTVFRFTWTKQPQSMPDIPASGEAEGQLSQTQILRAQAEAEEAALVASLAANAEAESEEEAAAQAAVAEVENTASSQVPAAHKSEIPDV